MSEHQSTKEALIVVQKGRAFLKMIDSNHNLTKGSVFNIAVGINHSLTII